MKIFCIGLSKTATTSLTAALNILGFRAVHWNFTRTVFRYAEDGIEIDFEKFESYDAFADTPIARIYPVLDKRFPGSKFILTVRDITKWDKSFREHFLEHKFQDFTARLHMDLYGIIGYDQDKCVRAFHEHTRRVLDHFAGREQDLLVMNIPAGDGWEALCPFLGKPVPDAKFPKQFTKNERVRRRILTRIIAGFRNRSARLTDA